MSDDLQTPELERPTGPGHGRAVVLFALVGLFAYFNSLHGDYVLDDQRFTNDPDIRRPFASSMAPRPLISLSLALNHLIDGLNPRGYHAMNLFAHVLAGLFVYDLVRRTLLLPRYAGRFDSSAGWIGLVTGLMWLAHPLNTQSVTYIIQRCESFMGLFLLASLWCYIRGAEAEHGRWWYVAAFVSCGLGAASKEMMIVLAPLALLYDRTFLTGSWRESLRRRWLPLGALLVPPVVGIMALVLTGFFSDPAGTVGAGVRLFTPYTYALTQTEVILHYLRLSFVPVGLTLDYLDWKPCTSLAACWPSVAAVAAIVAVALYGVLVRAAWAFPVAWFLVCLAPTSTIIPVQDAAFEHRMYLPLVGVIALVVVGTASLVAGRCPKLLWGFGIAAAFVIFTLGLLTASRNEDYSSAVRLLRDNAEKRPQNGRAQMNLAIHLFGSGDMAGAEQHLNEALRLPLQVGMLREQQVKVLRESGRSAEAVIAARKLVEEQPDSANAVFELGLSLLADDKLVEAFPLLEQAAKRLPQSKFARLHFAIALQLCGRGDRGAAEFAASRELDSGYAAQLSLVSRRVAGDPDAKPSHVRLAAWYADAAIRMSDSPSAEMLDTLAMCEARTGRFEDAAKTATRAAAVARARGDEYLASRFETRAARFREHKTNLPDARIEKP